MKRLTRNPAQTKLDIIERAGPIFNLNGYAGTSMQMIVDATGYQKGGIYNHFDSKMALAKEAFKYNFNLLIENYFTDIDPGQSPKEQLLLFMKNYQSYILNPTIDGGCPILNTASEVDDTDEEFRLLVCSCLREYSKLLVSILREGIKSGEFKSDINPSKEVTFFFATLEGGVLLAGVMKDMRILKDVCDRLFEYMTERIFLSKT